MEEIDEIEAVSTFLRKRNTDEQTIRHFKKQKMSTEQLEQQGCVRGDAMNFATTKLQEMKQSSAKDENKCLLVLSQGAKDRVKPTPKLKKSRKKPVRRVNLGWFHFNESKQTYVQVKSQKGGGIRVVELRILTTKDEVIKTGKDCFFPNGFSSFGRSDEMEFSISNFQREEVLNDDNFTLESYVEQFKLNRINLYLLSRRKDRSKSHSSVTLASGSDSELEKQVFATCRTNHASGSNVTTQDLDKRGQLIALHNEEYLKFSEGKEIVENLNLSLNHTPEHSVLNYNHDLMPNESIDAIALNGFILLGMRESDCMPPFGKEVNFKGFGNHTNDLNSMADNFVEDANLAFRMESVPKHSIEDNISGDSVAGMSPRSADLTCIQSSSSSTANQPSGYPSSNYDKGVCSHGDVAASHVHESDQDNPLEGTPSNSDSTFSLDFMSWFTSQQTNFRQGIDSDGGPMRSW